MPANLRSILGFGLAALPGRSAACSAGVQRLRLEHRLGSCAEVGHDGFLAEAGFDAALLAISAKLRQIVDQHRAGRCCSLVATRPLQCAVPALAGPGRVAYPRAALQVRLRCDLEELDRVLGELAAARPLLFVSGLQLCERPGWPDAAAVVPLGSIDACFDLYGYLRQSPPKAEGGFQCPETPRAPCGALGVLSVASPMAKKPVDQKLRR